jgi:HPt (histidine-containing phosphotransfer) domain-containing protein
MSGMAKIDRQAIEQLKDLVDDEDPDFFTDIIKGYIETTEVSIRELLAALNAKDVVKIAGAAHSLKGASGNIGALRIQEIAFELEKYGKKADLTGAPELISELAEEFSKVTIVLETEIETENRTR